MIPSGTRVLVVDDDPGIRFYLHDLLDRLGGIEVAEAGDGDAGLKAATSFKPDLILLDLMMPGMTGIEVCRRLRASTATQDIPVIVLSAASDTEHMLAAIEAGAEDFLPKPVASAELRAKVRTLARLNRVRILAAERMRLQWLLDHSGEALLVVGHDGRQHYANSRATELLGLRAGESVHVPTALAAHYQVDPADAWSCLTQGARADGARFALFRAETPSLPARWLDVEVCLPPQGVDQEVLLKVADSTRDVRRGLETWTFQHLISHKLTTPLNGLGPVFEFLDEVGTVAGDPEANEMLHVARQSAERLQSTVQSILRYQQAVLGPVKADRASRPATLGDLVTAAAEGSRFTGRIMWESGRDEKVALPELAEVVLTELVDNYRKFSDAPSAGLTLAAQPAGAGRLAVRLSAPGPDLPPDVAGRLGSPYLQAEKSFTGEVPGMGLGLATCRQLLRSRGGDLRISSDSGVVTTAFDLPASLP